MRVRRKDAADAKMQFLKTAGLILLLIIIMPAGAFAQAGDSQDTGAEVPAEGFEVSIDVRTGINLVGIIPGIPVIIGVPLSISPETVSITPQVGFVYYFDVLTDLHNEYYVPVGLNVLYNPYALGLDLLYYPAVGGSNTNHLMSVAAVSEMEILKSGRFSLLFELKFGSMFIFDPAETKAMIMVNAEFIPRFKL